MKYEINIEKNYSEACFARTQDFAIVEVSGDITQCPESILLLEDAKNLLRSGISGLIMNLRRIAYVNASFCGLLVSILKTANEYHSHLALVTSPDNTLDVMLRITDLDKMIDIYESMDVAREGIREYASERSREFELACR